MCDLSFCICSMTCVLAETAYFGRTYILEGLYFLFAAISSALALRKKPSGTVGRLGFTVITMFHVTLGVSTQGVDCILLLKPFYLDACHC